MNKYFVSMALREGNRGHMSSAFHPRLEAVYAQIPCLSAAIDNGLPVKVSKTASIALSESCRLAMVLVTALTSPPSASCIAGFPSGPFGHPLNLLFRKLSCHATTADRRQQHGNIARKWYITGWSGNSAVPSSRAVYQWYQRTHSN